jgi:hypothetical protein
MAVIVWVPVDCRIRYSPPPGTFLIHREKCRLEPPLIGMAINYV